jgi:hypothetical protein
VHVYLEALGLDLSDNGAMLEFFRSELGEQSNEAESPM